MEKELTGKPSVDQPWKKFYTEEAKNFKLPEGVSPFIHYCNMNEGHENEIAITYVLNKDNDVDVTHAQFQFLCYKVAKAIKVLGLGKEDVISVISEKTPEALAVFGASDVIDTRLSYLNIGSSENEILDYLNGEGSSDIKDKTKLLIIIDNNDANNVYDRFINISNQTAVENVVVIKPDEIINPNQKLSRISENKNYTTWKWKEFTDLSLEFENELEPSRDQKAKQLIARTSGTTSKRKAVELSKQNVLGNICGYSALANLERGKTTLDVMQIDPVYGLLNCCFMPLTCGSRITIVPRDGFKLYAYYINKYKPNYLNVPPLFYQSFILDPIFSSLDLSGVELMSYGGNYLSPRDEIMINQAIKRQGCKIEVQCGIANTETTAIGPFSIRGANKLGSFGIAPPGFNIKVVNPDNSEEEFENNQIGIFWYSGAAISDFGYLNNPELTEKSFINGWFCSGDYGYMDEDGLGYYKSRENDIIMIPLESGIDKVYPNAVEDTIKCHPAVMNCSVVEITPEGEVISKVAAKIALMPNADEVNIPQISDEIRELCKKSLSAAAIPTILLFSKTQLLYNTNGKIDKMAVLKECMSFITNPQTEKQKTLGMIY